ncbi:GNAT family N-acetyltransferase [Kibdelosporangium philippinense]|uniref:GNAT family N-acetyltransferase n=1 Tax=Kibdelosporangium philippinense TaxID=211113 RepID=A0ABS8Z2V9_9PSEU|nr:GNAT family N-acetyltransferase [Kibdelosporangium philippinense]MCE7001787.1 GNAT family N-acetyltransferase [Kibdelosporangium philippinense]
MIDQTQATAAIFVTDSPAPQDVAVISDGLDEFNLLKAGINDRRDLAVLARDPDTQEVIGGLTGRTSLGLLFVDLFYLPPGLRGAGLGSEILRQAEEEARRRGCQTGVVYTISFQAPEFYERNGWQRFGEIPSGQGTSRVFMTKNLMR